MMSKMNKTDWLIVTSFAIGFVGLIKAVDKYFAYEPPKSNTR